MEDRDEEITPVAAKRSKIRKEVDLKNRDRTNTHLIAFPEGDNIEHVREE